MQYKFKYGDKVKILEEFYEKVVGVVVGVHEDWRLRWISSSADVVVYDINIGDRIIKRNASWLILHTEENDQH